MAIILNGALAIDDNEKPVMGGVSSSDGKTIVSSEYDPITRRLLVDATGGGGSGTVTSVSVVSANGLAGTVANATTTPAITLSTTVTGVLKGNGTAISAATAGTDYQAPITLTTTGSSGAATLIANTLNIPQYSGGGTPGGSTTQLQYNNAGAFGGISAVTTDGTDLTATNIINAGGINFTGTTLPANGFYMPSANTVNISVASGARFAFTSTAFRGAASGSYIAAGTASSTVPTLVPNASSTTTGFGAQASGNISAIVSGTEVARITSTGINNAAIGATTTSTGAFTTLSASGHVTFEGVTSTGATGTGALVFATSPTLTTAVLGSSTATTQTPADNSTKIATTAYVDAAVLGQNFKEAALVATTANLVGVYVANVFTYTATGTDNIDGVNLALGNRVLVKNQTTTFQNGIYTVTTAGSLGVAGVLTRSPDANSSGQFKTGDSLFVSSGTANSNTTWAYTGVDSPTLGTDAITYVQTAGQGTVTAGNGITVTGLSVAIDTSVTVDKTTAQVLTNKDLTSGTNTFPTLNQNTTGSAATLTTGRTIAITGDLTYTSPSFNGSSNVTAAGTLATVNSNVGTFGSATQASVVTVNAKGLVTATSNATITPAVGSITGLGTGVATFLATPSSANLATAITDETGSGALVFATSPTLTSPVISTIVNSGTLTLPTSTDTLVGRATTDTLTNKTFDTGGTGNSFKINGTPITAVDGTGSVVLSGSPILISPTLTSPSTASGGIVSIDGTQTLTNKRINRRLTTTNAPGATPSTNTDNVDVMNFTGVATAITSMSTNLTGTPVDGQLVEFRFTDNATARAITWGGTFGSTTITLPTTTVLSTMLRVLCEWNANLSLWQCVAVA